MSQLDHVIIAGPHLEKLAADFHELTGVRPIPGGRHEGLGTANQLVGLGEGRYLELIGPDPTQPDPAAPRPLRVDDVTSTSVVGWAARPDDLDAQVAASRAAGYDPGMPKAMVRRTPTGEVLAWRLTPPSGGFGGTVPFLIDWGNTPHPSLDLPDVTLLSLILSHPEPDRVRQALEAVDVLEAVTEVRQGEVGLAVVLETPRGQVRIG